MDIAQFIVGRLSRSDAIADAEQAAPAASWTQRSSITDVQEPDRPSKLLKTLRRGRQHSYLRYLMTMAAVPCTDHMLQAHKAAAPGTLRVDAPMLGLMDVTSA